MGIEPMHFCARSAAMAALHPSAGSLRATLTADRAAIARAVAPRIAREANRYAINFLYTQ
jgi:hypothetical protein